MNKKNEKQKIVIGFDMDGVILDMTKLKISLARQQGFNIQAAQTPTAIIKKHLPLDVWHSIQPVLYHDPDQIVEIHIMEGAHTVLKQIHDSGIPYFLISRRRATDVAIQTLKQYRLWPTIFGEHNTFFVNEPADKNTKAVQLGITHYIDDEPNVLDALVDVPNRFLFDPHNIIDNDFHAKLTSWRQIKNMIFKI